MTADELQALDRMLAEKMMGYQVGKWGPKDIAVIIPDWKERGLSGNVFWWHPTTDIAQAFMVAEKITSDPTVVMELEVWSECSRCRFVKWPVEIPFEKEEKAETAICLAAKAWLERGGDGLNKCQRCGRELTEAEGGAIFTVCDDCWASPARPAEGEPMTPSKEAIEAAEQQRIESGFAPYRVQTESMLKAAYAIDFAALQQQIENVTKERNNFWKFYTDTQQENERLQKQLTDTCEMANPIIEERNQLRQENEQLKTRNTWLAGLETLVGELQQENERLDRLWKLETTRAQKAEGECFQANAEVVELRKENERLKARVQDWESAHQAQKERVEFFQQENEAARKGWKEAQDQWELVLKQLTEARQENERLKIQDDLFAMLQAQVKTYYGKDGGLAALQDGHRALLSCLRELAEALKELVVGKMSEWIVHNHGPEEGLGVLCPERLIGECVIEQNAARLEEAVRLLGSIIRDLPSKRDWLDPDIKKAAKRFLADNGKDAK